MAYTNPEVSVNNADITNLYDYSMQSPVKSSPSGLHKTKPAENKIKNTSSYFYGSQTLEIMKRGNLTRAQQQRNRHRAHILENPKR